MAQTTFRCMAVLGLLLCSASGTAQATERDLAYGPDPKQCLDLSVPDGEGFATVVFLHGGSLTGGDKSDEDYRDVATPFVEAGIACANANYRLAREHPWPAAAEDTAAAVAWVRENIGARGGDPDKIFLFGHSSGAMLVALVGADPRYLEQAGVEPEDVRGVIPMGSIMWDDDLEQAIAERGLDRVESSFDSDIFGSLDEYRDHWPIHHVRTGMPPFLFLIAEQEQEHPPVLKTNSKFVDDARALGDEARLVVLPDRTHRTAIRRFGEPDDPAFRTVVEFLHKHAAGLK